ncbi:aminotransferase class I/II-fold pyridoxal phosphate-dependent enzyme [Streptomyces sp. L7]
MERDLLVITDEVYEHLVFDTAEHIPLADVPGDAGRTVSIGSAGKTFSFTGWKVGWVTGTPDLVTRLRPLRGAVLSRTWHPAPSSTRSPKPSPSPTPTSTPSARTCSPSGTSWRRA